MPRISQRVDQVSTGDISGVTAGDGLSGGGTSGDVSLALDANELTAATAVSTDYVVIEDVTDNTTKKALVSDIVSLGDITGVTAGNLLDGGGTAGTVTLDVDLSEASTSTTDGDGDYFLVVDSANAQYKLTKANINLSGMNNDAGWTTATGDIDGVTAGSGLTGGGTSGTVELALDPDLSTLEDTTTARTLALTDAGQLIRMNNAGATTVTVPPNSSVAFGVGAQVIVAAKGAGTVTIAAGAGVTLRSKDSNLAIDGQYATASCVKIATDEWLVFGALA